MCAEPLRRVHDALRRAAGGLLLFAAGCAHYHAPESFLPEVDMAGRDGHGSWVRAYRGAAGDSSLFGREICAGELLAVDKDSLYLLPALGPGVALPLDALSHAKVDCFRADPGSLHQQLTLSILLTPSIGILGIIWLPILLLEHAIMPGDLRSSSMLTATRESWPELRPWCRFPQGLPPELDWRRLTHRGAAGSPVLLGDPPARPGWFGWSQRPAWKTASFQGDTAIWKDELDRLASAGTAVRWIAPAGLPAAWVEGSFTAEGCPDPGARSREFAGVLVTLSSDSLYLWSGGLRGVARSQLERADVFMAKSTSGITQRCAALDELNPALPAGWVVYPAGLPGGDRARTERELRQLIEETVHEHRWTGADPRWPARD